LTAASLELFKNRYFKRFSKRTRLSLALREQSRNAKMPIYSGFCGKRAELSRPRIAATLQKPAWIVDFSHFGSATRLRFVSADAA
jgi:hypothetical protein